MRVASDIWSVRQLAVGLRDARIAKGLTQAELSDQTGISRPWINQFEQGKIENASIGRVFLLCRTLDVTPTIAYEAAAEAGVSNAANAGQRDDERTNTYDDSSGISRSNVSSAADARPLTSLLNESTMRSIQRTTQAMTRLSEQYVARVNQSMRSAITPAMQSYFASLEGLSSGNALPGMSGGEHNDAHEENNSGNGKSDHGETENA